MDIDKNQYQKCSGNDLVENNWYFSQNRENQVQFSQKERAVIHNLKQSHCEEGNTTDVISCGWMYFIVVNFSINIRFRSEPIRAKCRNTTVTSKAASNHNNAAQDYECGPHDQKRWLWARRGHIFDKYYIHVLEYLQAWFGTAFHWMCQMDRTKCFPGVKMQSPSGSLRRRQSFNSLMFTGEIENCTEITELLWGYKRPWREWNLSVDTCTHILSWCLSILMAGPYLSWSAIAMATCRWSAFKAASSTLWCLEFRSISCCGNESRHETVEGWPCMAARCRAVFWNRKMRSVIKRKLLLLLCGLW